MARHCGYLKLQVLFHRSLVSEQAPQALVPSVADWQRLQHERRQVGHGQLQCSIGNVVTYPLIANVRRVQKERSTCCQHLQTLHYTTNYS